jgi:serine/threonine protein phosphatase PrpC
MNETSQESPNGGEPTVPISKWRVIGKSICGASHFRSGLPNQDAIMSEPPSGSGSRLILALSDGHGSSKSFRSQHGAGFAVKACLDECRCLLEWQDETPNLSAIKHTAEGHLPQRITRRWKQLVDEHSHNEPASPEELEKAVKGATSPITEESLLNNPLVWYGATLIGVVVTDSFAFYFQVGDGEILTVSDAGEVWRPLPPDDRLLGNETTSLCSLDAWRDFRVYFRAHSQSPPALILLSTDGYINSFTDAGEFLKVGPDFLKLINSAGLDAVAEKLEGWLTEASQKGSGDDITLGIISRSPIKEDLEQAQGECSLTPPLS